MREVQTPLSARTRPMRTCGGSRASVSPRTSFAPESLAVLPTRGQKCAIKGTSVTAATIGLVAVRVHQGEGVEIERIALEALRQ